jgi:hypothetical protein
MEKEVHSRGAGVCMYVCIYIFELWEVQLAGRRCPLEALKAWL